MRHLFALLLLSSGCASAMRGPMQSFVYGADQGYEYVVAHADAPAPAQAPIAADVHVIVDANRRAVGVNTGDERGVFGEIDMPDAIGAPEANAQFEQLRATQGATWAVIVPEYGPTFVRALERHLAARFRSARVELQHHVAVPADAVLVQPVLRYQQSGFKRLCDVHATVAARSGPLFEVDAHGQRSSAAHLAWAIPVMLATGVVVGTLIIAPAFGGINASNARIAIARAIDGAATQIAEHLAERYAAGRAQAELVR